MSRLRKAWFVGIKGIDDAELFFGPTAGKVRYQAFLRAGDAFHVRFQDISVKRAPERDVILPDRHPVDEALSDEERHCLLHAFGADQGSAYKAGYRDYFYTRRDNPLLVTLTGHGLMSPIKGDQFGEGMTYFVLTDLGKRVALSIVPEYDR